ncbi:hypothetical protein HQ529_03325 [Candidatus Woesearchaeota archaeon]|nr:hypothetical protein [Candidatus Woesearchaeota archaeon]
MTTRVNVNIPEALFNKSQQLIEKGFFSNFSELIREGIRERIKQYEPIEMTKDDRKLMALIKKADKKGLLISQEEMEKHGLKLKVH